MANNNVIQIDALSATSLLITTKSNGLSLETATGFIVERNGRYYLITNWHVVAGRHPDTNKTTHPSAALPERLEVRIHDKNNLGQCNLIEFNLHDTNGNKIWLEHPNGQNVDVVAIDLSIFTLNVAPFTLDLELANEDIAVQPAMSVSIIGFPFGLSAGGIWAIWKTGHIASDLDVDYDHRPAFLIDATTRGGMSGSPVIARATGAYMTRNGAYVISTGHINRFIGVYSGRLREDSELGMVWRPNVIEEIFLAAAR